MNSGPGPIQITLLVVVLIWLVLVFRHEWREYKRDQRTTPKVRSAEELADAQNRTTGRWS